jgi:predicted transcriptional regulator
MVEKANLIKLTGKLMAAYVEHCPVAMEELPSLLRLVHDVLDEVSNQRPPEAAPALKPAVPVRRSVSSEYLVCLEDGLRFKLLKRHLRTKYGMSPADYRKKWNLPNDYPMVAPNYATARSSLAKQMGLGQGGRGAKPTTARADGQSSIPERALTGRSPRVRPPGAIDPEDDEFT